MTFGAKGQPYPEGPFSGIVGAKVNIHPNFSHTQFRKKALTQVSDY
jgi:hypothetical protein